VKTCLDVSIAMRLNFIRAALSLDLNNSTLAHDAVGPSTPTDTAKASPKILRQVTMKHNGFAGLYTVVLVEGVVRPGDKISVS